MERGKKKPGEEAQSLEQLMLDKKDGKYGVVPLISFWAKELRKAEEHRHLTQNELLELAMTEVLGGKVAEKDILKKMAEAGAQAASEEAAEKPKKSK